MGFLLCSKSRPSLPATPRVTRINGENIDQAGALERQDACAIKSVIRGFPRSLTQAPTWNVRPNGAVEVPGISTYAVPFRQNFAFLLSGFVSRRQAWRAGSK
jgi:hypothetical protein